MRKPVPDERPYTNANAGARKLADRAAPSAPCYMAREPRGWQAIRTSFVATGKPQGRCDCRRSAFGSVVPRADRQLAAPSGHRPRWSAAPFRPFRGRRWNRAWSQGYISSARLTAAALTPFNFTTSASTTGGAPNHSHPVIVNIYTNMGSAARHGNVTHGRWLLLLGVDQRSCLGKKYAPSGRPERVPISGQRAPARELFA